MASILTDKIVCTDPYVIAWQTDKDEIYGLFSVNKRQEHDEKLLSFYDTDIIPSVALTSAMRQDPELANMSGIDSYNYLIKKFNADDTQIIEYLRSFKPIDDEFKDMNIVEFYTHLIERFNADGSLIGHFIHSLGYEYMMAFVFLVYYDMISDIKCNDIQKKHIYTNCLVNNYYYIWKGLVKTKYQFKDFENSPELCKKYMWSKVRVRYSAWLSRFWPDHTTGSGSGSGSVQRPDCIELFINPETNEISIAQRGFYDDDYDNKEFHTYLNYMSQNHQNEH